MDFFNVIKLAWTGLLTNKSRSLMTMLGIIIGVSAVIIIVSAGGGAQSLIYDQIQSLGTNLVGVLPGKGGNNGPPAAALGVVITTLKYEDAVAMVEGPNAVPHLTAITAYARGQEQVSYFNKSVNVPFSGVMAKYPQVIDEKIDIGRFFNTQEEKNLSKVVVLGSKVKDDLFGNEDPIGKTIRVGHEKFQVIGVFQSKGVVGFQNLDNQFFMPVSTAQKIMLGENYVGLIRGKVDSDQNVDQVIADMQRTLRIRHHIKNPDDDDFTVVSSNQALSTIQNITNIIKFVLAAVAAISLLVGGIGIMNVMLVSVTERTREIGLRKAIGAKPFHIRNQFLVEAAFITTCGGAIGIVWGMLITFIIALVIRGLGYHWDLSFSLPAIVIGVVVSQVIGIVFGYYPASKASKLPAIEALRYE